MRRGCDPLPPTRTRKEQWLLALLLLSQNGAVSRSSLASTLWPDSRDRQSRENLRHSLTNLRAVLGPDRHRLVTASSGLLHFNIRGMEVDIPEFDRAVASGRVAEIERGVALYRGPLLEACREEWVIQEREARERKYVSALSTLASQALKDGQNEKAILWLRRLLEVDPLREAAVRTLMQALARSGSYASMTQVYRQFRNRLQDELRVQPDNETLELYRTLRAEARGKAEPRAQSGPVSSRIGFHPVASRGSRPDLVGREDMLSHLLSQMNTTRLLTLTGPGGVGKSRLALAAVAEIADDYRDGVRLVDFSDTQDPAAVAAAVAASVEVRGATGRTAPRDLVQHFKPLSLLLVMEECSPVHGACASLLDTLLAECPGLRVLATSRQPLGAAGEIILQVPPLEVPQEAAPGRATDGERMFEDTRDSIVAESEAGRLFLERARAAAPSFRISRENEASVGELCRLLDGIPLAIELGAPWVRLMSIDQIVLRLRRGLDLLQTRDLRVPVRHRSLRENLDWSYRLLDGAEQRLFRRLTVFEGEWGLDAAEAVCGGDDLPPETMLIALAGLVDKSLVHYLNARVDRYRLLHTTRLYAREKLRQHDEEAATLARLCQ